MKPLVSVVIITYNSSKYILDTLESVSSQTYKNIELVISDDASTDNTMLIIDNWLLKNAKRFSSNVLIKSPENTGIASNLNRGVQSATGEWIKLLAGDDLLESNAIDTFIYHANISRELNVICSSKVPFEIKPDGIEKKRVKNHSIFFSSWITCEDQLRLYLRHVQIPPVTGLFLKKSVFNSIGGCDERFPMQEDRPLLMRILTHGYRIHGILLPLYHYRLHDSSVNMSERSQLNVTSWQQYSYKPVIKAYFFGRVTIIERINYSYQFFINSLFFYSFLNKKNRLSSFLYRIAIKPHFLIRNYYAKVIKKKVEINAH